MEVWLSDGQRQALSRGMAEESEQLHLLDRARYPEMSGGHEASRGGA